MRAKPASEEERMKIVFVIPDMPGGGTERVVALLANEYCRRGIETAILLFAGHETAYPLDERIEVISVGGPSGGRIADRVRGLAGCGCIMPGIGMPDMGVQCHGSRFFCNCRVWAEALFSCFRTQRPQPL